MAVERICFPLPTIQCGVQCSAKPKGSNYLSSYCLLALHRLWWFSVDYQFSGSGAGTVVCLTHCKPSYWQFLGSTVGTLVCLMPRQFHVDLIILGQYCGNCCVLDTFGEQTRVPDRESCDHLIGDGANSTSDTGSWGIVIIICRHDGKCLSFPRFAW